MDNRNKSGGVPSENDAAAAVQIIDKAQTMFVSEPILRPDGTAVVFASEKLTKHEIPSLNPTLPAFVQQTETMVEPASFIAYLQQFASSNAICRASLGQNKIECVLDYHGRAREGDRDTAVPATASHRATLLCPYDVDYAAWRPMLLGDLMLPQRKFVEFLQDMIHTIRQPDAATLVEFAEDLSIDRTVRFRSAANDRGGNVKFMYDEQDEGGGPHNGEFQLPATIELVVPIFQGGNPQQLVPRLRYRLENGTLMLGMKLAGIQALEREAFRSIGEKVRTDTKVEVFYVA